MPELRPLSLFEADQPAAPFHGRTERTRTASQSGARAALSDRAQKVDIVRRAWRKPYTMQEVSSFTGIPLTSICSIKACLDPELSEVGSQEKLWQSGRVTLRTVYQLTAYRPVAEPAL